jgi:hypothetical protein
MSNKKWKLGGNGGFFIYLFLKKVCLLVFLDDAKLNGNKKKVMVPRKGRK